MKKERIKEILDDSKSVKGTRKRSKEIEEVQKMLEEEVAYGLPYQAFLNVDPQVFWRDEHDVVYSRLAHCRRLAIAGWIVAFIVSAAFIVQNVDTIVNLSQYAKWVR